MKNTKRNFVALAEFISAARDSGYSSTSAALSELIDNAFQADANTVWVVFQRSREGELTVGVTDDGTGMKLPVLRTALQFGGSTRFNSREGTGRFGMGLPNSSLSQARRVEVTSWRSRESPWTTYLDLDEISTGKLESLATPRRARRKITKTASGTTVTWKKCDRIAYENSELFLDNIRKSLGQVFRKELWAGKKIAVNRDSVLPVDPLFLDGRFGAVAKPYGPRLEYKIASSSLGHGSSPVYVQFVTLPIEKWHALSNEQKKKMGISRKGGVSIVRAGREIDYGWFFMGRKRKENYDDWWRCEICFDPQLDECFGVTNTKQGIRPTELLTNILAPDLERIAHTLNAKIRTVYAAIRARSRRGGGEKTAIRRDHLLEPPTKSASPNKPQILTNVLQPTSMSKDKSTPGKGLTYRVEVRKISDGSFFIPRLVNDEIVLLLNKDHPFYECIYGPSMRVSNRDRDTVRGILELTLLAVSRAECSVSSVDGQRVIKNLREEWGRVLATFLE